MAQTHTVDFNCPKCNEPISAEVPIEVTTERVATSIHVKVNDLDTMQCPHCKVFIQIEVADMNISYEAVVLKTN